MTAKSLNGQEGKAPLGRNGSSRLKWPMGGRAVPTPCSEYRAKADDGGNSNPGCNEGNRTKNKTQLSSRQTDLTPTLTP